MTQSFPERNNLPRPKKLSQPRKSSSGEMAPSTQAVRVRATTLAVVGHMGQPRFVPGEIAQPREGLRQLRRHCHGGCCVHPGKISTDLPRVCGANGQMPASTSASSAFSGHHGISRGARTRRVVRTVPEHPGAPHVPQLRLLEYPWPGCGGAGSTATGWNCDNAASWATRAIYAAETRSRRYPSRSSPATRTMSCTCRALPRPSK